ncbi:chloride channel protein [Prescottella defluvii]|uniref:chloride channel protein n=1 Tax=Prescottella defluvii TaxID=1323361 RepID=UPI0004F2D1E8|nr:chloride channel protein [Prescottella defluvii]
MAKSRTGPHSSRGLLTLCGVAIVAGCATGFVGGAFRWCLQVADRWRLDLLDWAHRAPGPGWLVPIAVTAVGAAAAAGIVRTVPLAAGSGIQHVEAVARGEATPPSLWVVPARFIGGLLAIGSGLVLGREGPTVHMGAAIGAETGRRAHLADDDVRRTQSAVAGAGLAVAFNAPIGGALFVFEEVTQAFHVRVVVPTLIAVTTAVVCSRSVLGDRPDFDVRLTESPSVAVLPLFVVFGLLTGLLGVLYNRLVIGFLDLAEALRRVPPVARAGAIGAVIGLLLAIDPLAAGGGDALAQRIVGGGNLLLPVAFGLVLMRVVAGPLSYAAGTPGGLFAPLLAVGALWGVLFAGVADAVLPTGGTSLTVPMAIVGMAAFFGATVRAPLTGIVLVIEMTATAMITVPMAAATAAAVLVAQLAGSAPIYDSLRERMLGRPTVDGP